ALVHDFLLDIRGAERNFAAMCDIWPEADVFTALYDEAGTDGWFAHRDVQTSPLQRLHATSRSFRALLPLYPWAIERLDLSAYDLVVSSSSAWAHGVRVRPGAAHVCYCNNPFRYAWAEREATLAARNALVRPALARILARWRAWDRAAAQRVTAYAANSEWTADRIRAAFDRESEVIYPAVDVDRFTEPTGVPGDHYLVVGELMPHKRVDVIVEAFNRLGLPLVVAGDGPQRRRLERLAGPTVRLVGRVGDREVVELMQSCRALVVCAVEEFGIAPVEAQAAGRPVIAVGAGGVLETVLDGITGSFFDTADPGAIAAAVRAFDTAAVDPARCRASAERFDTAAFQGALASLVDRTLSRDRPVSA
ncbi:MAG: hypothetical protein QOF76_332, partial [Solirubrobacteraceae bacterium]|nr:hypothetical protein [Solirubrobacteraceae bacterium]